MTAHSQVPEIVTFGCRLNAYESEVMRGHAETAGLTDAVIVNTCAVTAEAERQARQAIRKARRQRPDARIIVTGCAAQIDPARYSAMPEVDEVIGNQEKLEAASFDGASSEPVRVNDIMAVRETAGHLIAGFDRPRACFRASAKRLRPPLHLLHHSVRSRQQSKRAARRNRRSGADTRRCRVSRDCAERRRHHVLRRRSSGPRRPRPDGAPVAGRRPRRSSVCVSRRSMSPRLTIP